MSNVRLDIIVTPTQVPAVTRVSVTRAKERVKSNSSNYDHMLELDVSDLGLDAATLYQNTSKQFDALFGSL